MEDMLSRLFNDFDRGKISRRHLLQLIGAAAVTAPIAAYSQGQCGGDKAGTPQCVTTPMPPPFAPTGWKTVLLDHFSLQVAELDKEAAYYNALMGWKVRSNDGQKIVLDIGSVGGVVMRGGLKFPPPTPVTPGTGGGGRGAAPAGAEGAAGAGARGGGGGRGGGRGAAAAGGAPPAAGAAPAGGAALAAGDNAAGGRGGGGGGRGGAGGAGPRAVWDGFCWGIEPWNTKTVEAELKKRGLNPVADHDGKDFFSFHVKDPDGFDVQVSNGNKKNRRTTPPMGELNMAPPFEPTGWQTVYLDHISFGVTSYKETVAFYKALLGWIPGGDEGSLDETTVAPEIGGLLIRGGNSMSPVFKMPDARRASMGHIAFGIANFDPDKVLAELQKRGLSASADTGAIASSPPKEHDIHTSTYKSYHTNTPNGFNLQISNHVSQQSIILG